MQKVNQEIYAKLIKFLMNNDATLSQIADKTGLHVITVGNLMQTFRKHKLVHVCDWLPDRMGRDATMVIRWGAGRDVKRFRMSGKERQRLCRERKKAQVITHPVSLITPLSAGL
jgi:predicted ArsR family transcriptional regulator